MAAVDTNEKVHVTRTAGVCGGRPCVAGTRIRVWDVVCWGEGGRSPEEIVRDWPQLTLADVHAAMAYYYDHLAEIEAEVAEDAAMVAQLVGTLGSGPVDRVTSRPA